MNPQTVLIATSNQGKLNELQQGLAPLGWSVVSLRDYPVQLPEETGSTFEENAFIKAAFAASFTGLPCIADDSGLAVDALEGAPGVYSARFGNKTNDLERNLYLLESLRQVPMQQRTAQFVAVLCIAFPDGTVRHHRGECKGFVLEAPLGEQGFGYDPLFWYPQLQKTFSQMTLEEKQSVSHRGQALRAMLHDLITNPYRPYIPQQDD